WHAAAVFHSQVFLATTQGFEQLAQRIAELQAAQPGGIRRADVDRDVAGVGIDLFQADQVVVHRALDRGVEVLADVDAQHATVLCRAHPLEQVVDAVVVEAHAVDDGLGFRQAEQARLRVARLRARRHGADLGEAETQLAETVDGVAVLVQTGGQSDRVGEFQTHDLHWQGRRLLAQQTVQPQTPARAEQVEGQFVRGFRRQSKEQIAGQGVHGRARWVFGAAEYTRSARAFDPSDSGQTLHVQQLAVRADLQAE